MSQRRFISWGLQFVGGTQLYFHREVPRKGAWDETWCYFLCFSSSSCCLLYGRVHFSVVKAITTPYLQHWDGHRSGYPYPELVQLVGQTTIMKFKSVSMRKPGRKWYSSNHRFRSNLAQMLGLMSKWLWQKLRSKYCIPFKLVGPPPRINESAKLRLCDM